jgi:hypothetical protein
MFGPGEELNRLFEVTISEIAQSVDYYSLDSATQKSLCDGKSFDPTKFDIYRFSIAPKFLQRISNFKDKKYSYSKVDNVLVQTRLGSKEAQFHGIYPNTLIERGGATLELSEISFEIKLGTPQIGGKFGLVGNAKDLLRKNRASIKASMTDQLAQWVLYKNYIDSNIGFNFQVLCYIPKQLADKDRYIVCDAEFSDGKRNIKGMYNRKVMLPK